jgi:hypothetical protein
LGSWQYLGTLVGDLLDDRALAFEQLCDGLFDQRIEHLSPCRVASDQVGLVAFDDVPVLMPSAANQRSDTG